MCREAHLLTLFADFEASVCDFKLVRTIDFPVRESRRAFRVLSRWSPVKFWMICTGRTPLFTGGFSPPDGEETFFESTFCCVTVPYAFSKELRTEALDSALSIAERTMVEEELLIGPSVSQ